MWIRASQCQAAAFSWVWCLDLNWACGHCSDKWEGMRRCDHPHFIHPSSRLETVWGSGGGKAHAQKHIFTLVFFSAINMTPQNERSKKKKSQLKYETLLSPLLPKQAHAVLNAVMATPAWLVVGGLKTPLSEPCLFRWRGHSSVWNSSWNASVVAILPPQSDR